LSEKVEGFSTKLQSCILGRNYNLHSKEHTNFKQAQLYSQIGKDCLEKTQFLEAVQELSLLIWIQKEEKSLPMTAE